MYVLYKAVPSGFKMGSNNSWKIFALPSKFMRVPLLYKHIKCNGPYFFLFGWWSSPQLDQQKKCSPCRKTMACENHTSPLLVHSCVYVLECHGGRFYIGVSQNLSHRFAQHFNRRGSQMTRTYRPLRVVEVIFGGDYEIEKKTVFNIGNSGEVGAKYISEILD